MISRTLRRTSISLTAIALLSCALLGSPKPAAPSQAVVSVRVTFYTDVGVTYSGGWTRYGVAACSWNIPMYSIIRFHDGRIVYCEDRGLLGSSGWIDVWVPSYAYGLWNIEAVYGLWTVVAIYLPE